MFLRLRFYHTDYYSLLFLSIMSVYYNKRKEIKWGNLNSKYYVDIEYKDPKCEFESYSQFGAESLEEIDLLIYEYYWDRIRHGGGAQIIIRENENNNYRQSKIINSYTIE